ncbi:MAG: C_GCAxxG_C_C family protein [Firmicutes bacterium]|nr:C_GCAxxG_C_C family protein [Bacillota bacterium]
MQRLEPRAAQELDSQAAPEGSPRVQRALAYHKKGYNCAQAVACAFAEELGRDEKDVFQIMEAFGLGMGMMGTCGAVSGMAAVVGMKESDGNLEKPATKKKSYQVSKELIRRFQEKNGSIICREIKGVDTKKVLRSCNGCIEDAVALLGEYLRGGSNV